MINTVITDGVTMDYMVLGRGAIPLVILPGVSLQSVLLSAPVLEGLFAPFTEKHTVYLFDRRREMPEEYDVAAMAEDTARAMEALGLSGAHVYGASQGGMIAQVLAARYPALVSRLAVSSTICRQNDLSRRVFGEWVRLSGEGKHEELNRLMFSQIYSPEYLQKNQEAFDFLARQGTEEEFRRLDIMCRACRTFDAWDEVGNIRCPVWATGSRRDNVLGWEGTREIAEKTGGQYFLYEGYSHAAYDEAPDFLPRLQAFFDQ